MRFSSPSRFPLTILLLAVCSQTSATEQNKSVGDLDKKPKVRVTISKETTFITEPLRPDGYPDYVAAMNERGSRDVTPENNAVVLLLKAYGLSEIPEKLRPEFFKLLGIEPLPEEGNYFVGQSEMIDRWLEGRPAGAPEITKEELWLEFEQAQERPWTAEEFPIVAEWLSVNKKSLQLIDEASRKTEYYLPLVTGDHEPPMMKLFIPFFSLNREAARATVIQAMNKVALGEVESAWKDLLAVHRLARLMEKDRWFIGHLVAIVVDGIACHGDVALAHHAKLSRQQCDRMRDDLNQLPIVDRLREKCAEERYFSLDLLCSVARRKPSDYHQIIFGKRNQTWFQILDVFPDLVDWDLLLRDSNEMSNRLDVIMAEKDFRKKCALAEEFENDLLAQSKRIDQPLNFLVDWFVSGSLRQTVSHWLKLWSDANCSVYSAYVKAPMRHSLSREMAKISLALAAYRAEHGDYPEQLDALVPKYLVKIPDDTFSENPAPLRYRREEEAYVLWTVHLNGVDDDGNGYGEGDGKGDDWAMRPIPKVAETAE